MEKFKLTTIPTQQLEVGSKYYLLTDEVMGGYDPGVFEVTITNIEINKTSKEHYEPSQCGYVTTVGLERIISYDINNILADTHQAWEGETNYSMKCFNGDLENIATFHPFTPQELYNIQIGTNYFLWVDSEFEEVKRFLLDKFNDELAPYTSDKISSQLIEPSNSINQYHREKLEFNGKLKPMLDKCESLELSPQFYIRKFNEYDKVSDEWVIGVDKRGVTRCELLSF